MKHRAKTKNIASAVMKISKDLHVVEEVQESLSLFSNLLKDDAQLRSFLQSKRFSFDQKSEVIHSGLKDLIHPIIQELIIIVTYNDFQIIFIIIIFITVDNSINSFIYI